MNTAELLNDVFISHEAGAPDVARTHAAIEAELGRTPARRPATALAVGGAVVTVVAIAVAAAGLSSDPAAHHDAPALGRPSGAAKGSLGHSESLSRPPPRTIAFRANWLPPGSHLNAVEVAGDGTQIEGYAFGSVRSAERGLTLYAENGPLMTYLRDGGTLRSTTVRGREAVEGYSALGSSYTVSIRLPADRTMTVTAYGFDRSTSTAYAKHTAQDIDYGAFPAPTPPKHPR